MVKRWIMRFVFLACALGLVFTGLTARAVSSRLKVCVYYDTAQVAPAYKTGGLFATMLRNLLGHFEEVDALALEAANYKSGDLAKCDRAAYIGSYYFMKLPQEFLHDVALTQKPFLWMNYGIWQLQDAMGLAAFSARTGFNFEKLVGYDSEPRGETVPGFFRYFDYKGARFEKFVRYDPYQDQILASPEIAKIKVTGAANVLSEAVNSASGERTPYVTEKGGFFYIADLPFSYIHEMDRYLIAGDVLFDFLGLPPRMTKHYALARLEDVHPEVSTELLYKSFHVFKRRHLPFALTLVPIYKDPAGLGKEHPAYSDLSRKPQFVKAIRYAEQNGGTILLHGVTHQMADRGISCYASTTGDDFEFWDNCRVKPVDGDSPEFVNAKLNKAFALLNQAQIKVTGWVTPHYQASPVDYQVFGQVFSRTMQRMRYAPVPYEPGDTVNWAGQFFNYTIRRDAYGQFVWPENLGNVNDITQVLGDQIRMPEQIIAAAKANLVLRDSWASFFWHPELIEHDVGILSLVKTVDAIRAMGYEYVSLKDLKARGE